MDGAYLSKLAILYESKFSDACRRVSGESHAVNDRYSDALRRNLISAVLDVGFGKTAGVGENKYDRRSCKPRLVIK